MNEQTKKVLDVARNYIGIVEKPAGSNNVLFNTKFYGKAVTGENYSWCGTFVGYCFWEAGLIELINFYNKGDDFKYNAKNAAYVPNWITMAKDYAQWKTTDYRPGDCVMFSWTYTQNASHIGIIESVDEVNKTLITIEGNTSNKVSRCTRKMDKTIIGVFRPAYSGEEIENSISRIAKKGYISNPEYWLDVVNGKRTASAPNVQALFDKLVKHLK